MDNLAIYNKLSTPPQWAQKAIEAGRLKGKTDINPQWRIMALTETFGMVGFGWKYVITNKEIIEGGNGEKIAVADIELFVKVDNTWSDAIIGTGGASFIAAEKNGLYTSDECFKMAITDAISVACKQLGIGASIYSGSKYIPTKPETPAAHPMTEEQKTLLIKHASLTEIFSEDERKKIIEWTMKPQTSENALRFINRNETKITEKIKQPVTA